VFERMRDGRPLKLMVIIEHWRNHYDTRRPHNALGYRPPAAEAVLPNG
jgi:transposase InsO family protein